VTFVYAGLGGRVTGGCLDRWLSRMRPSVVSNVDDADDDEELPGATSLSAAFSALAGAPGARRQVRLAVPVSTALGGGRGSAGVGDEDRRGCRATLRERSLFIFSEENFIRKYAKIIIEWGYPLCRETV